MYLDPVSIIYYDGVSSQPHAACLSPHADGVLVEYGTPPLQQHYRQQQMTLIGAIGQRPAVIELDNEARIEFQSLELPSWLATPHQRLQSRLWKLERTPALILFSLVFVVALGFGLIRWGIPAASQMIAFQLPANTLDRLGGQAEEYVMDMTKVSQIPQDRQAQIKHDYLKYIAGDHPAHLKFRAGGTLGANAMALPNNTIVVTDELIDLAQSDQEIIGVLAHEQGHLLHRHSLQQALSSLGFSVLYIAITGDGSDLLSSVPIAMVGADYSRQFEQESDLYALNLMHDKNIATSHFANLLQRLSEAAEEPKNPNLLNNVLASHPATQARIKMIRDFEMQHQPRQP